MTNGKWFALVAGLAMVLGLAACGGDDNEATSCTSSEDCADTETCDTSCSLCAPLDGQCTSDAQCTTAGETCQPFSDGCTIKVCKTGGVNPTSCTDATFDVCYDQSQYCASDAQGENGTCEALDVGSCSAVNGKETPQANGPMIYAVEANGACVASDQTHCQGGTGCAFNVYFWDPNADVDGEYGDVKYVTDSGTVTAIGFVDPGTINGNFGSVIAYTCVGYNPAGVLIQDNAGHQSNAWCLTR